MALRILRSGQAAPRQSSARPNLPSTPTPLYKRLGLP